MTAGSVSPSTTKTDLQGQATVTYAAPKVEIQTSVMITASFRGDNNYLASQAISRGTVLLPETANALENLKGTMENLELSVENLKSEVQKLRNAVTEGKVGASISIEVEGRKTEVKKEYQHDKVKTKVKEVNPGKRVKVEVSSEVENGRTIVLNLDNRALPDPSKAKVLLDNNEIPLADSYEDVLSPANEASGEYLFLTGSKGSQVLVSIPHFSTRTITIAWGEKVQKGKMRVCPGYGSVQG